jgi:hypothetical protein
MIQNISLRLNLYNQNKTKMFYYFKYINRSRTGLEYDEIRNDST